MQKQYQRKSRGFTIVETLIVLAIVGVMMLVVFLAVPALQRNQRNTSRKADVQNILAGLSEYQTNNNGQLPADGATGVTALSIKQGYYAATDITWKNNGSTVQAAKSPTSTDSGKMFVSSYAKCNAAATDFAGAGGTSRSIAVLYEIETSSGTSWKCQES